MKVSQHDGMSTVLQAVQQTPLPVPGLQKPSRTSAALRGKLGFVRERHRKVWEVPGRSGGRTPRRAPSIPWLRSARAGLAGGGSCSCSGSAVTSRPALCIHHFLPGAPRGAVLPARAGHCASGSPQWPAWPPRTPTCRAWPGGPACSTPRSHGRGNLVLQMEGFGSGLWEFGRDSRAPTGCLTRGCAGL